VVVAADFFKAIAPAKTSLSTFDERTRSLHSENNFPELSRWALSSIESCESSRARPSQLARHKARRIARIWLPSKVWHVPGGRAKVGVRPT
jgi:hypothetical protein